MTVMHVMNNVGQHYMSAAAAGRRRRRRGRRQHLERRSQRKQTHLGNRQPHQRLPDHTTVVDFLLHNNRPQEELLLLDSTLIRFQTL
jgi:hypothetical protein